MVQKTAAAVVFGLLLAACGSDTESAADLAATQQAVEAVETTAPPIGVTIPQPDRPIVLGDKLSIDPLDTDTLIVEAETIVFDTFNGGSITLAEASPEQIDQLLDRILPIDTPNYEVGSEIDWLTPDDVVIGYVDDNGGTWAYPLRILNFHEIVNDQFAGVPVLISYCPLCGSGVVFDRRINELTISFSNTSALHENDMVMVDRETGSYWWQVPGRSIGGVFAGDELEVLPSETARWGDWLERHPDTQVLERPINDGRYDRDPFIDYTDNVDQGLTPFPVSQEALADQRLTPGSSVLVTTVEGETRVWPVDPPRIVEDSVGGVDVTVELNGVGGTIVDADGASLPSRTSLWFAIIASFPDATVGS